MQTGKEVGAAALLYFLAPTLREPAPSKADDDGALRLPFQVALTVM